MTFLRLQHLASAFWETIYIIINSELDNEVEEEVFLVYLLSFSIDPSTSKISLIIQFGEFGIGSMNNPLIDILLYTHHVFA